MTRGPSAFGSARARLVRRALALGSVALAGSLVRCSVYDESLLAPATSAITPNSGVGWWSGAGDRGCFSAKRPEPSGRPTGTSPTALPPIYLAVQATRLGSLDLAGNQSPDAWRGIGFDLDGVCTGVDSCPGTDSPPSCQPTVPQISVDGDDCRDNTFGRLEFTAALVPELAKKYGLSDDAFNCALCVGDYNYLFKISDYNGEANDEQVRVDLYGSPGLETPLPWDCSDASWKTHPCFTPDNQFTVTADAMNAPGSGPNLPDAKTFDGNAYVRDGYLVVTAPDDTDLWFPGYKALVVAYPIKLQKGVVAGKLTRGGDNVWRITDGTIGGRIRGTDVIQGFRDLGLCDADPNYQVMVDFVNRNLDVLANGANDPTAKCDAMSAGISFTAQQVLAGPVKTVEPLTECVLRGTAVDDAGASDAAADASDAGPRDAGTD